MIVAQSLHAQEQGVVRTSLASTHKLSAKAKIYKPKIFKPMEYHTLKILTEMILMDDGMPGVKEAKAYEFIDFQIAFDPEIQARFRSGLAWLDRHSRRLFGRNFTEITASQRKDILQCLEIKAMYRPGEEKGREFFELARRYTYMAFYASEDALRVALPPPSRPKRQAVAGQVIDDPPAKN